MEKNQEIANVLAQAIVSSMEKQIEEADRNYQNPPSNRSQQKYAIDEEVDVQSWGGVTRAKITGVDWIFHNRLGEWTWGYSVDRSTGLAFHFIPEGYLRKVE